MRRLWISVLGAVFAVAVGSGCDTADIDAYCDEVVSCQGLNDKDKDACIVTEEYREDVDCDVGCGDEHVAYYDCILEKGSCQTDATGQPCQTNDDCFGGQCTTAMMCESKRFSVEDDDCKAEREAYQGCSFF